MWIHFTDKYDEIGDGRTKQSTLVGIFIGKERNIRWPQQGRRKVEIDRLMSFKINGTGPLSQGRSAEPDIKILDSGLRKAKLMHISFASDASHVAAYAGNIKSFDLNRMRVPKDTPVATTIAKQIYKAMMKTYPGEKGFEVTTFADLIKYLPQAVVDGHTFIEYNLEGQFVPDLLPSGREANSNHVEAFTVAAQAAHERGLKISAAPIRNIIDTRGTQIAPAVDMIHVQLQKFQEVDPQLLRNWLNTNVPKIRAANPHIEIYIQFSTSWRPAPGLSMLDTFKRFTNTVYSVPATNTPDGIGYWVLGDANMAMIGDWLRWYNETMRGGGAPHSPR